MSISSLAYANDYGTPQETITITDKETGEVTKYTLDEDDIQSQVSIDENTGEKSITAIYEFGQDSEIDPFTTSSTQDELNGWRGNVQITYTVTSSTACLEKVNARLQHISGSSELSYATLDYGQDLGTNSDTDSYDFNLDDGVLGVNISTRFSPGKFGYDLGHKIGAVLTADIGNKTLEVESSVNF